MIALKTPLVAVIAMLLSLSPAVNAQTKSDPGGAVRPSPATVFRKESFKTLWHATCDRSPDVQFVKQKLFTSSEDKSAYDLWIEAMGNSSGLPAPPGDPSVPVYRPPADNAAARPLKKYNLNQSERIALFQMLLDSQKSLDSALDKYLSTDQTISKKGRDELVTLAGSAAVEDLDKASESFKNRTTTDGSPQR